MKFSIGWVANVKQKWSLRTSVLCGEDSDQDQIFAALSLPLLNEKRLSYAQDLLLKATECGLNKFVSPKKTTAYKQIPGSKNAKERITILFCFNANVSKQFETTCIGAYYKYGFFIKYGGLQQSRLQLEQITWLSCKILLLCL